MRKENKRNVKKLRKKEQKEKKVHVICLAAARPIAVCRGIEPKYRQKSGVMRRRLREKEVHKDQRMKERGEMRL